MPNNRLVPHLERNTPQDPKTINSDRSTTKWVDVSIVPESGTANIQYSDVGTAITATNSQPAAGIRFNLLKYRVYSNAAASSAIEVVDSASAKRFSDIGTFTNRAKVGVVFSNYLQQVIHAGDSTSSLCSITGFKADESIYIQFLVSYW